MSKDPVFSLLTPTGVQKQHDIIEGYVDQLMEQLSLRSSRPVNIVAWLTYTVYDILRDLSFGEHFTCLDNGKADLFVSSIPAISKELTFIQIFRFYGVDKIRRLFMPKSISGARAQNMARVVETVTRRTERNTDRKDFLHYILAAMETDKGMSREEMEVNAFSFSIAGSESSSTTLSAFTFYICTHPDVYNTLVTEIRETFASEKEIVLSAVANLPYLNAVQNEVLRIHPPVAITLPRVTPAAGAIIDNCFVPGGTTVGVNHFAAYHDSRNFHCPNDFLPERWTGSDPVFEKDEKESFQPFSFGPRNCLGRNLAWAELRLITARLLYRFDLNMIGCEKWDDQKIWGFWVKEPLWVELHNRDGCI
ncbi:hypothetical protein EYZ11_003812 [Aspergillus tanneri]|uniref:Uncharacterized protein n=1 Tax=Aspergillus tanneri TaxID=1220188 RepID=A0A4S3JM83_9EURO|nr:hypothetical protein EYZ11_003812 [Aspergillus tanneri]